MALVNQPPILASSFAVNGDKNTIPTTNSGTEGLASLSLGFPPITQQPVSQGGIPPQRADFNGIFNLITNFLMFIQNGSIFAYSSSLDYQPPAIVYGNNALYRCIATNGANTSAGVQPLSNTSYWQPLIPVGGITVSGNTITVTNETGTQIRYTIDTITNPPSQSDSSNKIVTSAWVKAYAPSKTGSGASGTWNITATKATQDSDGNAINTTYVKKVNGTADGLTCVDDTFGGQLTVKRNSANATTIKFTNTSNVNRYIGFTSYDKVMYRWGDNGDGQTAFLDASNYNNYAPTKTGGGASGTWNISISGNAKTSSSTPILSSKGVIGASSLPNTFSTGLTTHSDYNGGYPAQYGNVININNRGKSQLLLEWRGDDVALSDPGHLYYRECRDTQNVWSNWKKIAFTSDNVASATKATQDKNGLQIDTNYLKLSGGTINGILTLNTSTGEKSIKDSDNVGLVLNSAQFGLWDWRDKSSVWSYSKSGKTFSFSRAVTAPTPPTSDNSTKLATTAFVKSLFTASKTSNGWWKDGNTGMIWQWGTVQGVGGGKLYNFPISFPNAVLGCSSNRASRSSYTALDGNSAGIVINNKSSFYAYDDDGSNNVNYIAVGY